MIRIILQGGLDFGNFLAVLVSYAVILFICLPVHEMAHALVAHWLGDDTGKMYGRLTINPFAHLDLIGTLMIVVVGFGYAKPVPVNPYNFKNRKVGMALTALAGPVSNLLMATLGAAALRMIFLLPETSAAINVVMYFLMVLIQVNISLAVFNLLPIPPLDGSRIFALILPDKWVDWAEKYSRYIQIALLVLIFVGVFDKPLNFLFDFFLKGIFAIFGM